MKKVKKLILSAAALTFIFIFATATQFTSAEVTSGPFYFVVHVNSPNDSSQVQKTNNNGYASAHVEHYSNSSNVNHLVMRVRRGTTAVTGYCNAYGEGTTVQLSYFANKNVTYGQTLYLRGLLDNNAAQGEGMMRGTWTP